MKGELANLDATEQAELLRPKEVSPLELPSLNFRSGTGVARRRMERSRATR
jgi:hypothetical protein